MYRRPFWMRSVRRRPAAAVSLLVLSAIAVAVSVTAPVLLRSVEQQTLAEASGPVGGSRTSIVTSADANPGAIATGTIAASDAAEPAAASRLWTTPVTAAESTEAYALGPAGSRVDPASGPTAALVAVGSDCAGARLLSGRCPVSPGQVAVSRSAARSGLPSTTGESAALSVGTDLVARVSGASLPLTVVGVYDDRPTTGRFLADPASLAGASGPSGEPSLVVSDSEFDTRGISGTGYGLLTLRHTLRLDDVVQVRKDIAAVHRQTVGPIAAITNTQSSTGLPRLLDRVEEQHRAAEVLFAVVTLEALALAWFAVALAVQRIGRVRAQEWGLTRLRGLPARRRLATIFLEPGIALVAGGIAGFGLGTGLARVGAAILLGPDAPVEPLRPLVFATAGLALLGALVALVAASVRSARLPLSSVLRESTEPRAIGRGALVAQTGIVLVTATVVYSLLGQTRISGPQLALLAPSLIAVVVGLVAVQLAIAVIRRGSRRAPRSLGGLVIGRQLGRAPSVLMAAVMVSLGLSVATYSAEVAVVAIRLQHERADAAVGASTVLSVQVPQDVSLLGAVRRADPTGRQAMAAEVSTTGNGPGRFVAIDTPRLAAVSSWRSEWSGLSPSALAGRLAPPHGPSFTVRGSTLRLSIAGAVTKEGPAVADALRFEVVVQAVDGWHTIRFGPPRDGALVSPSGSFPCSKGCRLVYAGLRSSAADAPPFTSELTVTSFSTDEQSASDLAAWLDPERWRNRIGDSQDDQQPSTATLSSRAAGGLRIVFTDDAGGSTVSAAPRDAPEPLPAVVGTKTGATRFAGLTDTVDGVGPDLSPLLLHVVARAPAVPRVLDEGVLVDLEAAERVSDAGSRVGLDEVWLAPGASPAVLTRLRADGITVTGTRHLGAVQDADAREAPPRAALAGLPVGAAALLLTLLAAAAIRVVGSRGRLVEWRSLITAGVPPRRLRRLLALEALLPSAAGALLGIGSGLVAFWLTIGRLPLLAGAGPTPPPDLAPAPLPIAVLALGTLLLLTAAALVGARIEFRRLGSTRIGRTAR
ncbi:FtsX-like permease family protein [Frondihabitans peucedani]